MPISCLGKSKLLPVQTDNVTLATGLFYLTDDIPKKKVASIFRPPSPDVLAYLDFSVSTTGILAGVKVGPHECPLAAVSCDLKGILREQTTAGKDAGCSFRRHYHIWFFFFLNLC